MHLGRTFFYAYHCLFSFPCTEWFLLMWHVFDKIIHNVTFYTSSKCNKMRDEGVDKEMSSVPHFRTLTLAPKGFCSALNLSHSYRFWPILILHELESLFWRAICNMALHNINLKIKSINSWIDVLFVIHDWLFCISLYCYPFIFAVAVCEVVPLGNAFTSNR